MQKPLWVKINKNDFDLLIQDVYSNLNNNEFKTTINKKTYDLKNVKNFLEKITIQKISEKDAKNLYSNLIDPDITMLKNAKSKDKNKINDILNALENLKSILTGVYLHYKDLPKETMFERSIAKRITLKKGRLDENERIEQSIDNELFKVYFTDYQSPSNMYK